MKTLKFFDAFAGVGGFSLGIDRAYANLPTSSRKESRGVLRDSANALGERVAAQQPTCVGFSEIDKYCSAVLKHNYPNVKNYGCIKKIDWFTVPDFDLLTGGSPCQDFSVAGKRAGLDGKRSGLFTEYLRALHEKRPKYFIWENVKGVLSSRSGWDFANIQAAFSEAGYSLWWQVLNAKDFGVPQNRERIIVVGFRGGSPREILFERGEDPEHPETCGNASCGEKTHTIATRHLNRNGGLKAHHFSTIQSAEIPHVLIPEATKRGYAVAHEGSRIRRITPRECERLMSWPDNWTRTGTFDCTTKCKHDPSGVAVMHTTEISDSQRYKMCGNGVVSNVIEQIIKQLIL